MESGQVLNYKVRETDNSIIVSLKRCKLASSLDRLLQVNDPRIKCVEMYQSVKGIKLIIQLKGNFKHHIYSLPSDENGITKLVADISDISVLKKSEEKFVIQSENIIVEKGELPIIIVDPGHGGDSGTLYDMETGKKTTRQNKRAHIGDPGAIGKNRILEKDIVLSIALKLKEKLEKTNRFRVKLTRDGDYYLGLKPRIRQVENAVAFISIHCDSSANNQAHGSTVYHLSEPGADNAESQAIADKENKYFSVEGDYDESNLKVRSILVSLKSNNNMMESSMLANHINQAINKKMKNRSRGVKKAGFVVLRSVQIPSILFECGFMSNPKEESLLKENDFQDKICSSLSDGLEEFVVKYYSKDYPVLSNLKKNVQTSARSTKKTEFLAPKNKTVIPEKRNYKSILNNIIRVADKRNVKKVSHIVEKGDTLFHIAKKYKSTVKSIREKNRLKNDLLRVGQVLFITN